MSPASLAENSTLPQREGNVKPLRLLRPIYEFERKDATEPTQRPAALELWTAGSPFGSASVSKSVADDDAPGRMGEDQLDRLLAAACDEQFEVGIASRFSTGLRHLRAYDYELVLNDATEPALRPAAHVIWTWLENVIIQFPDALGLYMAGFQFDVPSVNKSVVDDAAPSPMVEAQLDRLLTSAVYAEFEVGMESRFSTGLQNLYAYAPVTLLFSLKARFTDRDTSPEVLADDTAVGVAPGSDGRTRSCPRTFLCRTPSRVVPGA